MSPVAGLLRSTHPGPSVTVTVVTTVLAVSAGAGPASVALVAAAVLANQFSIGLGNDAIDAGRDRDARRGDKPVASGAVDARLALVLAIALGALSLWLAAGVSLGTLVADLVFLAAGWAYNLLLKRTPLSLAAYLVGFAAVPAIAVYARQPADAAPVWWATLAAALLGGAAHFANVLPDLVADRAAGIRGLPQRLGRTGSVVACFGLLAACARVLALGLLPSPLGAVAAVVTLAVAGVGIAVGLRARPTRLLFRLVILAALLDAGVLAAAGRALLQDAS